MQLRIAPSLGALEGNPHTVWGTTPYYRDDVPTVFFGLYGLPDFYALWKHQGGKYILWAGSDIRHFINGYWLEDRADGLKLDPKVLANWINKYCESWVENRVEYDALKKLGIESKICPSFMGNVDDYEISYVPNGKYYASVSGNDFKLYCWDKIEKMAAQNPSYQFHLYGNTVEWKSNNMNVFVHGKVPKEQMNEEIKHMQGGIRLLKHDGFSEIIAKSILWGQWPISAIPYSYTVDKPMTKSEPNIEGRNYYRKILNNYPWNENH